MDGLVQTTTVSICDAARPLWRVEDGPVGPFGEALFTLASPLGTGFLVLAGVALVSGSRLLTALAAALGAVMAWLVVIEREGPNRADLARAAMSEGCLGSPALVMPLIVGLTLVLIAVARRL